MKDHRFLISFALIFVGFQVQGQVPENDLAWADQLLEQEISYPVLVRLEKNPSKNLPALNRLTEACLIGLEFSRAGILLRRADSLIGKATSLERAYLELNWSRYYYERSDYINSVQHVSSALRWIESMRPGDRPQIQAKAMLQLGKSELLLKKMKESKAHLDQALTFYSADSIRYPIKLAQTLFSLGLWSKQNDQYDASIVHYQHAIRLFEASREERYYDLGKCFNNLAATFSEMGDYGEAKRYNLKALDTKKKHVTDSLSLAITYTNLGKFYYDYGNYFKAKGNYKIALELLDEENPRHRERLPELMNNYGAFLMEIEEQQEAENTFRRGLGLIGDMKSETRLSTLLSLSGLLLLENKYSEADDILEKARQILLDSQSTKRNNAIWHLRKANLLEMKDISEQAEQEFNLALKFSQPANTLVASEIYQGMGQLQLKKKNYAQAQYWYKRAHAVIEEGLSSDTPQSCTILNLLGESYLGLNKYDSAIYYLQWSINNNVRSTPDEKVERIEAVFPFELIASYYQLSETYQRRFNESHSPNDLELSVKFIDMGLRAIDSRRKSLSVTNDQLVFDSKVSALFERAMEAYQQTHSLHPKPANLDRIFYISELSKSQALGQSLRESNLKSFSNVSASLLKEEELLRREIQAVDMQNLRELKYGENASPDLLKEYTDELGAATRHYQRLQDSIQQNLPGYYQLKYNKTLVTVSDIQRDVLKANPNAVLIQYSVGDSATYVQVITDNNQKFYKVDNAQEIRSRIVAMRNQIKLGITDELYGNSVWLYQKLIQPALVFLSTRKQPTSQLIIVPDQILCYLPFEALMPDAKRNEFLIQKFDISYSYSSTLLWQKYMEKSKDKRNRSFMGVAPEFISHSEGARNTRDESDGMTDRYQFEPLTSNKTEVDVIKTGMEKSKIHASVLEGQDATEASFRKLDLRQYDYVHFATHGFVDMDNPQFSGVAFSRNSSSRSFDDILFTNEVYEMQFGAELVCLSSCDSGIGKLYRGEGMIGLSQAFLFAGARSLAVSLWKVEDTATSELMIDFYGRIPKSSLSAALSGAKRKMVTSKKYSHPYYWSSFILVGM